MRGPTRKQEVSPRPQADIVSVCRIALVGTILLLIVIGYYPFAWDPPRSVRNDVSRSADGSLQFGETNYARSPGTPAWLPDVRTSGIIQVQVEFNPQAPQQNFPASVMMLASDSLHTDFAIVQDHSELVVWLRRPGSDVGGGPPYVIKGALRPQGWNHVDMMLRHGDMRIDVGGSTRLLAHLPSDSARDWSAGQIALGNEVHGGTPWLGQIRLAEVRTPGHAVNYVRPGALSIPESYLYLPDHIQPFPPTSLGQWLLAFVDLLTFVPVGFLIVWARRPPLSPVSATLLATALAVLLGAGKFLFHGRHTSLINLLMEVAGAWLGSWLASRLTRTKRADAWPRRN